MTLEQLKKLTDCTVNENEKILINPIDKHSFTAFPLDLEKPIVEVSLEEYIDFVMGLYEFNDNLTELVERKLDENTENNSEESQN